MSEPIYTIRTVEFPLVLTEEQKKELEQTAEKLKTIWNIALNRILDWDNKTGYGYKNPEDSSDKTTYYGYCCPINWEYRKYPLDENGAIITNKKQKKKPVAFTDLIPFSRLVVDATVKKFSDKQTPYLKELKTPKLYSGAIGNTKVLEKVGQPNTVCTTDELTNIQGTIAENGCSGFSCPIYPSAPHTRDITPLPVESWLIYEAPFLDNPHPFGLGKVIKNENLDYRPDREELLGVTSAYRTGTINSLAVSWQEYDKSRKKISSHGLFRGQPKFKKGSDKIRTIIYGKSPKQSAKKNPEGDPLKDIIRPSGNNDDILKGIPQLKQVQVKGLDTRWRDHYGNYPRMTNMRFVERHSGWTIQLTGYFWINPKIRESKGAIGADMGLQEAIIFDNGKSIPNPRFLRSRMDSLSKTQRQISQKRTHRLILWLNHPDRTIEDVKSVISVSSENAKYLLSVKSEKEGKEIIEQQRWNKLLYQHQPDSKALIELATKNRKQHFQIAQARKAFWNRLSTWLVRNYDTFICEDGLQKEQLRKEAQPNYKDGQAMPNQKKAKAGLNLSLSDLAPGMFMQKCKTKFEEVDRTFIRFPAMYTTKNCPVCETPNDMGGNYMGQQYHCSCCGYTENRDQKAAIYIMVKSYLNGDVAFDQLSEPSKQAVLKRLDWEDKQDTRKKKKRKSSKSAKR